MLTMSDISNLSISSSSKRRLRQIDDTIEYLTQDVNTFDDIAHKTEFECALRAVKMKREKIIALTEIAEAQEQLSNMVVAVAETDLLKDIERLKHYIRTNLDLYEDESRVGTPSPPQVSRRLTTATVSVQTTESMCLKKNKTRCSSSRTSPSDISSEELVHKSSCLHQSPTNF